MSITKVALKDQLKLCPDIDQKAIDELKQWNDQITHIPKLIDSDLTLFYISNSYDLEATKRNIENYFVMRYYLPEFFSNRKQIPADVVQQVFDAVFMVQLTKRTKDNKKVIMERLIMEVDPTKGDFDTTVNVFNMVLDAGIYDDGPDNKYVFVCDLNGATMAHKGAFDWAKLKTFYAYYQKGAPLRWFGAHFVNTGPANKEFEDFVKAGIADNQLSDMITFHPNLESLMSATGIERSILPNEMGGEGGASADIQKQQYQLLESHRSFFDAMDSYAVKYKEAVKTEANLPSFEATFGHKKA